MWGARCNRVFFLFRCIFWLGLVVLLLPASPDGSAPPPRVSVLEALSAARVFVRDISGACERNPHACAVGGDTVELVRLKIETGADIVGALISSDGETISAGTLTKEDLAAEWSAPANQ